MKRRNATLIFLICFFIFAGYAAYLVLSGSYLVPPLTEPPQAEPGLTIDGDTNQQTGDMPGSQTNDQAGNQEQTPDEPDIAETRSLKIVAVGDIMFGRNVGKRLSKHSEGYYHAFSKVNEILKEGDVVFGNLEAPITDATKSLDRKKKIILKADPLAIYGVKSGGFNILSLANNHMMDYYAEGLEDTIEALEANGILHSGGGPNLEEARKPAIFSKNGVTFAVISYSDMVTYTYAGNPNISYVAKEDKAGLVPRDYKLIKEDIDALKGKVDLIAVSLHWGVEESFKITDDQIEFARKVLDDGADMILGHHPHQFQGIEVYKGKPILYSMGNFLFDQNDPENMESFIVQMEYEDSRLKSLSAVPVRILEKSRVERQTGDAAKNILERQVKLCAQLGTKCRIEDDILVFDLSGF